MGKETNSIYPKVNLSGEEESMSGEKAMADLFFRYAPALFAYLRWHTASRENAEDLLHEIFLAALQWEPFDHLSAMEQEKWLWRVARNKIADTHRQNWRKPSLSLDPLVDQLYAGEEQSPEYRLMRHEEYARLRAALEQLPALQQEALRLRYANGLSCAEVAKVLGKREGALRSMLSRAVSRLRAIYANKKEG